MKLTAFVYAVSALLIAITTHHLPKPIEDKRALISPPPYFEHLAFGFHMSIADILWIRSIQNIDYCEIKKDSINCNDSGWVYHMLDTITTLSPDFRIAYATGAVALSIIVSDIEGATQLFDKAEKDFPKDYPILYRGAYHAMVEEKNNVKAARRLIVAAQNGGAPWFYSLANRLYADAGRKDLALTLYSQMQGEGLDENLLKRMKDKIDSIPDN